MANTFDTLFPDHGYTEDMTAPNCINHGCGQPATYSGKDTKGNKKWRVHCGNCQKASYGATQHKLGVTPWKIGKCSNIDGHLGFPCPIDYEKAPWASGQTEVDHKDGDHNNNDHANLDELCPCCHKEKSKRNDDHKGHRYHKL